MGRRGRQRSVARRAQEANRWAAIGAIAAVVAIPVTIGLTFAGPSDQPGATSQVADLRATLEVRNGPTEAEQDSTGRLRYTAATQPTIYVNLRNDGGTGTAIDRVELKVVDMADIRYCDPRGGEFIEPWRSGVHLPSDLTKGSVVFSDRSVDYNVGADDAGRLALALIPAAELLQGRVQRAFRFAVRLRQVSDQRWIDAGSALVMLPSVWPRDFDGTGGPLWEGTRDAYAPCVASNLRTLRQLARGGAELSVPLRSLVG